jgi:hypothetical protein
MRALIKDLPQERTRLYGGTPVIIKDPPHTRTARYIEQPTAGVLEHFQTPRARVAAYSIDTRANLPEYRCTKETYCLVGRGKDWTIVRFNRQVEPNVEGQFAILAAKWREEVGPESSVSNIVGDINYLKIIAMGKKVVPLILRELEREPAPWFVALQAITGENPADRGLAGNFPRIAEAWLQWGRDRGFINGTAAP